MLQTPLPDFLPLWKRTGIDNVPGQFPPHCRKTSQKDICRLLFLLPSKGLNLFGTNSPLSLYWSNLSLVVELEKSCTGSGKLWLWMAVYRPDFTLKEPEFGERPKPMAKPKTQSHYPVPCFHICCLIRASQPPGGTDRANLHSTAKDRSSE